ncbi:prepilin-type N-terminal cleavage/methylation domain-containing protein [Anaerorhabdus sp.]|uniref:prepilin-type N-terminal cleavage/methylation domain-containing protein n=1 Tax=Anaerorhabdus sp. TaxID=1872524 RepID=UPI002FC97085
MNKKGMTLIELIVSIAIIGIIMTFVASGLLPVIQNYGVNKKIIEGKDVANNALAYIKNEIRNAKGSISVGGSPCDASAYYSGKTISLYGMGTQSNLTFNGNDSVSLFFTTEANKVNVTVKVDGYTAKGSYAPYKTPAAVIKSGGAGGSICIVKEAPTTE